MCNSTKRSKLSSFLTAGSYNWSKYQMYFDISQNKKKNIRKAKTKLDADIPKAWKTMSTFFTRQRLRSRSITIGAIWGTYCVGHNSTGKQEDSRVKTRKPQTETQLQHTLWIRIQNLWIHMDMSFFALMYRHPTTRTELIYTTKSAAAGWSTWTCLRQGQTLKGKDWFHRIGANYRRNESCSKMKFSP